MKSCPECYSEYDDSAKTCPVDDTLLRTIDKDPLVGTMLANRYQIVSVLGRGGMGVVYKARQEMMDKFMAIKMLHSHLVAQPDAVQRFTREAKTVSQVKHHHIITLYDFGMSAQRQPYLVMDYLEGTSLKNVIKDDGPMPFDRAERIYTQVIEALAMAHSQDLVHRDLKPENIMLSKYNNEPDWVTLVDFGLSKLKEQRPIEDNYQITKTGDVCGSPPYMSPEQCLSSTIVDPRSDIYSLAVCVYETLSNKLPFNAKSAIEMLDCHLYATPIPFNLSGADFKVCNELTAVLNKALQKEPEKRHQSVQEFGEEFNEAIRRDSVKLKAYRHRMQTSEFADLASEAEALSRQLYDSGRLVTPPLEEQLEGVQFIREQSDSPPIEHHRSRAPQKPTDRRKLETDNAIIAMVGKQLDKIGNKDKPKYNWTHCPYCDAPAESGVRFCLNCRHQFISPEDAAKLKMSEEANIDYGTRGFSSRAKKAAAGATGDMTREMIPRVMALVVVLAVAVLFYVGYTNGTVTGLINRFVPQAAPAQETSESGTEPSTSTDTAGDTGKPGAEHKGKSTASKGGPGKGGVKGNASASRVGATSGRTTR